MNRKEDILMSFLKITYLRPENALLSAFKSTVFDDIEFKSPSIDISCGDGLTLFLHFGGKLDPSFDKFISVKAEQFKHSDFVDIYDFYKDDYDVKITKKADIQVDVGTDWKESLLKKAEKVGLYKKLVLHDNNKVPLPFPDNHFMTVHSNSIYWVKDVKKLVKDVHRMMHPDGTAIIQVMTPFHLQTLENIEPLLSRDAIDILDRKRRATMPSLYTYKEWNEIMESCGFKIEEARSTYPNELIMDIWNIGLRPVAHLLIRMSEALPEEERKKIKKEWVDIFFRLFKPLLNIVKNINIENAPYIMYKLSRK